MIRIVVINSYKWKLTSLKIMRTCVKILSLVIKFLVNAWVYLINFDKSNNKSFLYFFDKRKI